MIVNGGGPFALLVKECECEKRQIMGARRTLWPVFGKIGLRESEISFWFGANFAKHIWNKSLLLPSAWWQLCLHQCKDVYTTGRYLRYHIGALHTCLQNHELDLRQSRRYRDNRSRLGFLLLFLMCVISWLNMCLHGGGTDVYGLKVGRGCCKDKV